LNTFFFIKNSTFPPLTLTRLSADEANRKRGNRSVEKEAEAALGFEEAAARGETNWSPRHNLLAKVNGTESGVHGCLF
jgi:hypothetical protein